ncbi:MAG TPA: hypothetical protein VF175_01720 [Lacipirellula sp.]
MARSLAKLRAFALIAGVLSTGVVVEALAAEPTKEGATPAAADAKQDAAKTKPAAKPQKPSTVSVGGLEWRTDYNAAYRAAKKNKRMLLINFLGAGSQQQSADQYMAQQNMINRLARVERARVSVHDVITVNGQPQRLGSFPAFAELQNGPGFVLIDLQHVGQPYYGRPVNILPFASGKYYRWENSHLHVALDLPPGTLTQRTMIWAVRIHPENPASTYGIHHPTLSQGAASHSAYQASIGVQGHHHFESRYGGLTAAGGEVSEVVAESWPGQNLIDSCIDCVDSWRHSPGHWRGVAGRHRAFGFDIRRGRNGIWYGTGIFAN